MKQPTKHQVARLLEEKFSPLQADQVFDLILAGYWDWNLRDNTEYLSPTFKQMFGYADDELPNSPETWQKLIFPEDLPGVLACFEEHVRSKGKIPYYTEVRYRHRNGSTVWVICSGKVVEWSEQGEPLRMVGCHVDITALKTQQAALQDSEERWKFAIEGTGDGLWDWNVETGRVFYSTQWKAMLGYQEDEIGDTLDEWSSRIHPDDRAAVEREVARHLSGESAIYISEHRVRCKDGSYKWILDRGRVTQRGVDGAPLREIGTHSDISERRDMERRLKESEARFRLSEERLRNVLDTATGVSVIATDPEGMITYFSRGAEELLGYTSDEVVGKYTPVLIHDPVEIEARARELSAQFGEPIEGFRVFVTLAEHNRDERREWTYFHKDGSRKAVELCVTASRDPSGKVIGYLGTAMDISERKRLDAVLRENERKFRAIFELSPVGIALNDFETGAFVDANSALLESVGYSREEFTRLTYWEITPREYDQAEHEQLESLRKTGRYGPFQKEYIHRDGHRFPVLLSGMLVPDASGRPTVCSIIQDISEIKRIERDLRTAVGAQKTAYALLEAAGRIARVGHWEVDLGTGRVFWSDVTCEIHEMPPGTSPDLARALDYFDESHRERVSALVERSIETGEAFEFEALLRTATGAAKWVLSRGHPVRNESNELIALRGIFQDIDGQKQVQELIAEKNHQLEAATQKAHAYARAKAQFLANMSHEIRTPLNAVIGMTELLAESTLGEREQEFVDTIRTSGDMLITIINDILDFSKIESGQLGVEAIPVVLSDCVESALHVVSPLAAKKGLELLLWIDPSMPSTVEGDPTRLRQVLVNLLTNAVKFTEQGEVFVKVSKGEDLNGCPVMAVQVQDSGIGISPENIPKLFQAFSQADSSTTRKFGGTGLGLAISRRLVELMGGRIWVESKVGQGSAFHFEIPVRQTMSPAPVVTKKIPFDSAGRRVLIVDDNATSRWILKTLTESWGMDAVTCESVASALETVTTEEPFDLGIIDSAMSDCGAHDVVERLQRGERNVPVVILNPFGAKNWGQRVSNCREIRLTKPVRTSALVGAIDLAFGKTASEETSASHESVASLEDFKNLSILVAEDNPVNQRVIEMVLNRLNCKPTIVPNGTQTLAALAESRFDILFLDVQMPDMDGMEVAREVARTIPVDLRPWIVALTANALEGDREMCLLAGMQDYLTKPVRMAELKAALARAAAFKPMHDVGGEALRNP